MTDFPFGTWVIAEVLWLSFAPVSALADLGAFNLIILGLVVIVVMLKASTGIWGLIRARCNIQFLPIRHPWRRRPESGQSDFHATYGWPGGWQRRSLADAGGRRVADAAGHDDQSDGRQCPVVCSVCALF